MKTHGRKRNPAGGQRALLAVLEGSGVGARPRFRRSIPATASRASVSEAMESVLAWTGPRFESPWWATVRRTTPTPSVRKSNGFETARGLPRHVRWAVVG